MIYVGIDPGINTTGVVALRDGQTVVEKLVTRKEENPSKRIEFNRLADMVERIVNAVSDADDPKESVAIAIEEPFVGANGGTALKTFAVFIGVVMELRNIGFADIRVITPPTLKKYVGAKQKNFVARQVYKRWGYEAADDNLVDAFAIAKWCSEQ